MLDNFNSSSAFPKNSVSRKTTFLSVGQSFNNFILLREALQIDSCFTFDSFNGKLFRKLPTHFPFNVHLSVFEYFNAAFSTLPKSSFLSLIRSLSSSSNLSFRKPVRVLFKTASRNFEIMGYSRIFSYRATPFSCTVFIDFNNPLNSLFDASEKLLFVLSPDLTYASLFATKLAVPASHLSLNSASASTSWEALNFSSCFLISNKRIPLLLIILFAFCGTYLSSTVDIRKILLYSTISFSNSCFLLLSRLAFLFSSTNFSFCSRSIFSIFASSYHCLCCEMPKAEKIARSRALPFPASLTSAATAASSGTCAFKASNAPIIATYSWSWKIICFCCSVLTSKRTFTILSCRFSISARIRLEAFRSLLLQSAATTASFATSNRVSRNAKSPFLSRRQSASTRSFVKLVKISFLALDNPMPYCLKQPAHRR